MNYICKIIRQIFFFLAFKVCIVNCKFIFNNVACVYSFDQISNCIIYHQCKCLLIYCIGHILQYNIFIFVC